MIEEVAEKIQKIKDLGSVSGSVIQIADDFEKMLSNYDPLKAYDVNNTTKVEYRIKSDTDVILMVSYIGLFVNNVFTPYQGVIEELKRRGYENIQVSSKNSGDIIWLTFSIVEKH